MDRNRNAMSCVVAYRSMISYNLEGQNMRDDITQGDRRLGQRAFSNLQQGVVARRWSKKASCVS